VEEIMASNERLSMSMAAVLASVNLCDEWMKAQSSSDHLRGQLKQYLDDASRSRQEVDEGKREIMRLRAEIQDLKLQIAKMDNKTRP
jgi:cell division protein ZapA